MQVEKREVEVAAERDELLRRLRELEASKNGSDGDKAELALLRSRCGLVAEARAGAGHGTARWSGEARRGG